MRPDRTLLMSAGLLTVFGLMMLQSASFVISLDRFGSPYVYLARQALFGVGIGLVGFLVFYSIPYQRWERLAPVFLFVSLILMGLVFVPGLGFGYGGAQRWIHIGSISIQPSEILKLGLILYLAAWFSTRSVAMRPPKEGLMPFLIVMSVIGLLVMLQPDMGTLGVIVLIGVAMCFVGGGRLKHIGLMGLLLMLAFAALVAVAPYRMSRVTTFLNPHEDVQGSGYQLRQSLIAISTGGITGMGLGYSRQKHYYVPETFGDTIFAVLAEELGLIGVIAFFTVLGTLLFRGLIIARHASDQFGRLVAAGIVSWIGFQSFINVGATAGVIPFTGIPLPFISYGSTSLAMIVTAVGLLANISKRR